MKPKNKKTYKIICLVLVFLIIAIIIKYAGQFLVIDERPQKADAIIVLAGDRGYRMEKGAELFRDGYAPYIIVSGGQIYNKVTWADLMMNHAVELLGIPEEAVIKESKADSTYQNALYSREIMQQRGLKSAIVVTSNYHMCRSKLVFDRIYNNSGIKLVYCGAQDANFTPQHWWSNNKSIMITFNEYAKLLGYFFNQAD